MKTINLLLKGVIQSCRFDTAMRKDNNTAIRNGANCFSRGDKFHKCARIGLRDDCVFNTLSLLQQVKSVRQLRQWIGTANESVRRNLSRSEKVSGAAHGVRREMKGAKDA